MLEPGRDRHLSRERVARSPIRDECEPKDFDRDIGAGPVVSRPVHLVASSTAKPLDDHEVVVDTRACRQLAFQHAESLGESRTPTGVPDDRSPGVRLNSYKR